MSALGKCPLCREGQHYRRQYAGRNAARKHRCVPQPAVVRGCRPADLEDQL